MTHDLPSEPSESEAVGEMSFLVFRNISRSLDMISRNAVRKTII